MNSLKWRIIVVISGIVAISLIVPAVFIQHMAKDALAEEVEKNAFGMLNATTEQVESQYNSILYHKSSMLERRKIELKNNIEIVFSMIEMTYIKYRNGYFNEDIAKKNALIVLKNLRYGDGVGYFWVNDLGYPYPKMIMHPTIPGLDGQILDDPGFNCALGKKENLFKAAVDITGTSSDKDGYIDYLWPKPTSTGLTQQQPKISYVRRFEPWNWVIGTGVYIDDIEKDVQDRIDTVINDLNNSFKTQKIGEGGYFFIFNEKNKMLVHPNKANVDFSKIKNPSTGGIFVDDIKKVVANKLNVMEYKWDRPGYEGDYRFSKRVYVSYFEPLGWYICSSVYIDDLESKINKLTNVIIIFFSVFSAIAFLLALLMSKSISNPLNKLISIINETDKDGIPIKTIPDSDVQEIEKLSSTLRNMISSITESRKVIEESEAKFRGLIESSTDIVWEVNLKGIYEYISPRVYNVLGYKPEELIGQYAFDFMPPGESERVNGIFRSAVRSEKTVYNLENINAHKNGNKVVLETNGVPFYDSDGVLMGYRGVSRDITQRKEDEKELNKRSQELAEANKELMLHKQHLLELVDERTKELNESLENLKKTQDYLVQTEKMAALGGLVAGVAHEINTPVGVSVTAASFLDDKTKEFSEKIKQKQATDDDHFKYFDVANESARIILSNMEKAAALIQSFKQVAVDQSYDELREFNVKSYIDEILLSVHSKFKKTPYKINVICATDFSVYSYPGALSQILTNLLMNSLFHGFEGCDQGTVTIEVEQNKNCAEIVYKDDGNGVSKNNLKHICEPFFTTKRGKGGSGLGMQIVYNLVTQVLKGQMDISSKQGEGITIKLEFPTDLRSEDLKNL